MKGEISKGDATRNAIKLAARRLFAARGIDGVAVREIVAATGQKNGGSLHYYFRTKEALVRELIADGGKLIDDRRNAWLDRIEAGGGPRSVREVIEALVWPSTNLGEIEGEEDTYLRFISNLGMQNRELLLDVLANKWNTGYLRCLAHIRRLVRGIPAGILEQRLVFMSMFMRSAMAARERALDHRREHARFWTAPPTMENFIDTVEAMLSGPVSTGTRRRAAGTETRLAGTRQALETAQSA